MSPNQRRAPSMPCGPTSSSSSSRSGNNDRRIPDSPLVRQFVGVKLPPATKLKKFRLPRKLNASDGILRENPQRPGLETPPDTSPSSSSDLVRSDIPQNDASDGREPTTLSPDNTPVRAVPEQPPKPTFKAPERVIADLALRKMIRSGWHDACRHWARQAGAIESKRSRRLLRKSRGRDEIAYVAHMWNNSRRFQPWKSRYAKTKDLRDVAWPHEKRRSSAFLESEYEKMRHSRPGATRGEQLGAAYPYAFNERGYPYDDYVRGWDLPRTRSSAPAVERPAIAAPHLAQLRRERQTASVRRGSHPGSEANEEEVKTEPRPSEHM